ncbi:MAG: hypothetical protein BWY09_00044 [Candidatus Hydrogenedentes bacterium ADurb.Bin179]|nr:MAG: hypothetical protein BWY09_00044 [Candidatus Hydrogenedentes bacterium ADurb.Bin179]
MLAVNAVGMCAVRPAEIGNTFTFKFDQGEIAPAGEVKGDVMVARAAGAGVGRAQHLQVQ